MLSGEQPVYMVHHALAGVLADLQVAAVHADRILWASLDTEAAVNALAHVDRELVSLFLDIRIGVFVGHDINAVGRADRLAHHATHAARAAILTLGQVVGGAQTVVVAAVLLGVLDGHRPFAPGLNADKVQGVEEHVHHKMTVGDPEPLENFPEISPLEESEPGTRIYRFDSDITQNCLSENYILTRRLRV